MSNKQVQAVVIIHGMGEQRPMDSLRGFVKAVWSSDKTAHNPHIHSESTFSKPDSTLRNFELRRLTTVSGRNGWRTDFYELYWAHMMHSTSLSHLLDWFRFLMLRWPKHVPNNLLPHYFLLWLIALIYVGLAYIGITPDETFPRFLSVTGAIFLAPALFWFLKNVLGDAARYFFPSPANVQRRQEIRNAGVSLLKSLHDSGYERIVIVGHSLGSVIGYDILTHTWPDYNVGFKLSEHASDKKLGELETITCELEKTGAACDGKRVDEIQQAQEECFDEFRNNGSNWRVTDFITLGSPLAHARVLLARNDEEFRQKLLDRELPQCPPVLEKVDGTSRFSYKPKDENDKKLRTYHPHHAALFGVTRWTNLYFPVKNMVWGDFIAGPLRGVFGQGIRDIPVYVNELGNSGFFSHTRYWQLPKDGTIPPYIGELRKALDIANDRASLRGRKEMTTAEKGSLISKPEVKHDLYRTIQGSRT